MRSTAVRTTATRSTPVKPPPPAVKSPVKTPVKAPIKTAAKLPKAAAKPPTPPRVPAETPGASFTGAGGRAWRMSGKHAVAYVRDASLAGELLATETRHLARSAMAVYYDRKGKPFAWQLRFDTARWEEVVGRLG